MNSFSKFPFDLRRILIDTREIGKYFVNKKELLYTDRYQSYSILYLHFKRPIKNKNIIYQGNRNISFDLDFHEIYGPTELIEASVIGNEFIVQMLLNFGAIVDCKDDCGNTPLIIASSKGYFNIVRMLLDAGADVNIGNNARWTAIKIASLSKRENIIKILEEYI